jgi:hypothetical protein
LEADATRSATTSVEEDFQDAARFNEVDSGVDINLDVLDSFTDELAGLIKGILVIRKGKQFEILAGALEHFHVIVETFLPFVLFPKSDGITEIVYFGDVGAEPLDGGGDLIVFHFVALFLVWDADFPTVVGKANIPSKGKKCTKDRSLSDGK